ncbi:DUF4350 domain-containing protein [Anseongella ginsenosidimutans]|nr:DUF4350 domain-containing protein [Anseongella ginsenosidimutans]QEC51803.1 DUF4350 domain-containing protein [Anseongella ginsenosidimutans]
MKKRKINGYMVLLLLLALAYILVEWYRPEPVSWSQTYINTDKIPYGTYALFELLNESFPGADVETVRVPAYNLFSDSTLTGNYLFIGPRFRTDEYDLEALLGFVGKGNTAFIAAGIFEQAFLDSLHIETETGVMPPDSLVRFVSPYLANERYSYPPLAPFTWFSGGDSLRSVKISEDLSGKANFIRVSHGQGNFYLHSQPAMFSNYYVLRNRGHEYAFRALSYLPLKPVLWDEYYKQGRVGSKSLLGIIGRYITLRWAWYLLLGGVILYIVFLGKRRQRVIPLVEPLKNTSLEFAGVVSSLYYNQRDFKDIALKKCGFFLEHLRNRYQEASEDPLADPGFVSRLSAKSGIEKASLEELFRSIAYVKVVDLITEAELHALNNRIEDFYKKRA